MKLSLCHQQKIIKTKKIKTMKQLLKGLFLIGSLTALFTSCKKENLSNTPTDSESMTATTRTSNAVIAAAPTYTLTKCDGDSLVYYNDGRLAKVLKGTISYTQYNYGFNTVTAKKYSLPGNQLQEEITYFTDVQSGHVYESKSTAYSYNNNGAILVKKTFKYEYDASGHLTKKYNKDKTYERSTFSWGADGNLVTIAFYNEYNYDYSKVKYSRHIETDKLKLQSKQSLLDPYLKIFGKGSKNMAASETVYPEYGQTPTSFEQFNYNYNSDGYPTKCTISDANAQLIRTFNFRYIVSR
jgi:hypothetical protein